MNKLTKTEKAYIAGIIDGEGLIQYYPYRLKSDNNIRYILRIYITNTKTLLINWLKDKIGFGYIRKRKPAKPTHNIVYSYTVSNRMAEELLREVYPYMLIKRKQCEIVWEMSKTIKIGNNQTMSKSIHKKREELLLKLRKLNKRGL